MKRTLLIILSLSFVFGYSSNLVNPSWSSTNLNAGETGTYTFSYQTVTASPNMIIYALWPYGSGFNANFSTATVTINGNPVAINTGSSWGGTSSFVIRLTNAADAPAGSNVVITVEITNPTTAGTYNWSWIRTADAGGNEIDGFASPPPVVIGALSNPLNNYEHALNFYPNPAKEKLNFNTNSSIEINKVFFINSLGKLVGEYYLDNTLNHVIDISFFNDGIYFIKTDNSKIPIYKLIVSH